MPEKHGIASDMMHGFHRDQALADRVGTAAVIA